MFIAVDEIGDLTTVGGWIIVIGLGQVNDSSITKSH